MRVGNSNSRASRGLYFLGDDEMFVFVVSFLNSVRRYNTDLPLCFIPFNDHIDKIEALQERFNFSLWRDQAVLAKCDHISTEFHGSVAGHYRKLAIWEGDYDEFVYIDIDTTV